MSRIVYADHAATTALSDTALKAMLPYFNQSYGNPSSLYSFAQQAKSDLEAARVQVAARPTSTEKTSADITDMTGAMSRLNSSSGASLSPSAADWMDRPGMMA